MPVFIKVINNNIYYTLQNLKNTQNVILTSKTVARAEMIVLSMFSLFFFAIFIYTCTRFDNSPLYNWQDNFKMTDLAVTIVSIIFLASVIFWLLVNMIFLRCNFTNREVMKIKVINVLVLIGFCVGIFVGGFQAFPSKAMIVLSFTSVFNFYVMMIQYFYTPSEVSDLTKLSMEEKDIIHI